MKINGSSYSTFCPLQTLVGLAFLVAVWAFTLSAHAINYYAGGRVPDGFVLNLYPYWHTADKFTGSSGKTIINNLGMDKYGVLISGSYYTGDLLLNAIVPVGKISIRTARDEDSGLGDMQARVGYFLPLKDITILPTLVVKIPTGNFDKNKTVNLGDGQIDIIAELYFNKLWEKFSTDWLAKYTVRCRNTATDVTPGNEFATEGLVTYKVTDNFRLGPSINFVSGDNNTRHGKTIADSGIMKLAVGGEFVYRGFKQCKVSLAVQKDIVTQNSTEGTLLFGRFTIPF